MQISVIKWQMSTNIDLKLKVDLFILCLCYVFEKQLTAAEILMNSGYSKLMASGQQENFFILFQKAC